MTAPEIDPEQLAALPTEAADPRYASVDAAGVAELAAMMNAADATVPGAVERAMPQIVPAVEAIADRLAAGGRLFYVGAGTPGRIGVLDASEVPPTFGTDPALVQGVIAGGHAAILTAQEGAEDDTSAARADLAARSVGPADAVVGITSSGRTPYVLAAVDAARAAGALTVGLSCNAGAALSAIAEHGIEVVVGPEVLAGSTRLKAGTAQKLVLNMISTISMVRMGKAYGNLMVDLQPTNAKLRERATRTVQSITGASREQAIEALRARQYQVKPAVLLIEHGLDAADAADRLDAVGGQLRAALRQLAEER